MYATAKKPSYADLIPANDDWPELRAQLLLQWNKLTKADLEWTGPNRHNIAVLVQNRYGVSAPLVENYLFNLERTLPELRETHVLPHY